MEVSTATPIQKDPNDTSNLSNNYDIPINRFGVYNRKVRRYAKKNNISTEKAFMILYK